MQSFSGEAFAHDERVRAHLARMESSPIRRVRQRTEGGPGNATVTSRGSTTSSTAMAPIEDNQSATTERHHHVGQVAQTRDDSDCPDEQEQAGEPGENMPNEEGDTAALMQRSHKRKRGSPEPAPRLAGSTATASFSWRILRPPRGTPRARGRGRPVPPSQASSRSN